MLDIDTTRRPVRPGEWGAVLDAVYNAEPSDEQTWLEWKSTLDLRSKDQIATIVSKAIIAFANRDPDEAAATVGGIGILLIGIEPGSVSGVSQVDNADLDKLVSTYVGADGPLWQPHWIQYQGKTVLVIEVYPPQWGDPAHTFRKAYQSIPDGQIYVRKRARSEPVNHLDVRRLMDRYATGAGDKSLDIAVGVESPVVLSRYTCADVDLQDFIASERERLMKPLEEERIRKRRTEAGIAFGAIAGMSAFERAAAAAFSSPLVKRIEESRTEEQYDTQVESYLEQVREAWPDALRRAAAHFISPPVFRVTNRSTRNYRQLEVKLHVAGLADVIEHDPDTSGLDLWALLPKEPRLWGPYTQDLTRFMQSSSMYTLPPLWHGQSGPSTTIERGGSFSLAFSPVDLRPEQSLILERGLSVLIPSSREEPVTATWVATATNVDAPARGQFTIPFDGPDMNVYGALLQAVVEQEEQDS